MKMNRLIIAIQIALVSVACGGAEKRSVGPTPGDTHSTPAGSDVADQDIQDIDVNGETPTPPTPETVTPETDAGTTEVPVTPPDVSGTPSITFVLKNEGDAPLSLNMDKGWQAVIFSYKGTPPNAKSMLMFPTHCTASCDAGKEDICPYCPAPQRARDIKAAENHDEVKSGDFREVKWDLFAYDYEKARGTRNGKKNARCNCYKKVTPEPGEYTVKACGLRKTQNAKKRSQYQCVEVKMSLPVTESTRIELNFE